MVPITQPKISDSFGVFPFDEFRRGPKPAVYGVAIGVKHDAVSDVPTHRRTVSDGGRAIVIDPCPKTVLKGNAHHIFGTYLLDVFIIAIVPKVIERLLELV